MTEEMKRLTRILANTKFPEQGSTTKKPIKKIHVIKKKTKK